MKSKESGLFFFKVFDLAFFAPGVVIALTLAWICRDHLGTLDLELSTASGVLAIVLVIGGVYASGIAIFSAMWFIFRKADRSKPEGVDPVGASGWPVFPLLFEEPHRTELILYFWYLRATCFGLAFAFALSALVLAGNGIVSWHAMSPRPSLDSKLAYQAITSLVAWFIVAEGFAVVALILQGKRFNQGVDRSLSPRAKAFKASWSDERSERDETETDEEEVAEEARE